MSLKTKQTVTSEERDFVGKREVREKQQGDRREKVVRVVNHHYIHGGNGQTPDSMTKKLSLKEKEMSQVFMVSFTGCDQ